MVVIVLKNLLKMSWVNTLPNDKDSMIYAADNMILIGKIAGFLGEDKFATLANKFF